MFSTYSQNIGGWFRKGVFCNNKMLVILWYCAIKCRLRYTLLWFVVAVSWMQKNLFLTSTCTRRAQLLCQYFIVYNFVLPLCCICILTQWSRIDCCCSNAKNTAFSSAVDLSEAEQEWQFFLTCRRCPSCIVDAFLARLFLVVRHLTEATVIN